MPKVNITEISNFIDRYKDFSKRLERQKIVHYRTKFDGLLTGYRSLNNMLKAIDRKEARSFNIFNILNVQFSEVRAHTPFLKNLLDPNGTHGQTDLFLSSFIQRFIVKHKRNLFELSDYRNFNVIEEKPIHNGRIDIYIHSFDPNNKFGLVIENKLFAGDQKNQIKRYYDFLYEGLRLHENQMMIFYLTIDGGDPSAYSINEELRKELKKKNILKNLSYKEDIRNWLTNVVRDIESLKVRNLITQYSNVLKML